MAAAQSFVQAGSQQRRSASAAVWTVQILLSAFMIIASGLPKFAGQKDAVETFAQIGWGQWFRYFTGAVEVAGGIGLLIPRLASPAAVGLIMVMIGAIITNIALGTAAWAALPAAFGVLFAVIAWYRLPQAKGLIDTFRR